MTLCKLRRIIGDQRGFTLIEVIVALAIISLIGTAASTATIQILKHGARSGSYTAAGQYTMSAIRWIGRDAEMSQTVDIGEASGFPLTLGWIDWENVEYQVVYTIEDGTLKREYSVDGSAPSQTIIAKYINSISENTTCEQDDNILTLKVTATIEDGASPVSVTNKREIYLKSSR